MMRKVTASVTRTGPGDEIAPASGGPSAQGAGTANSAPSDGKRYRFRARDSKGRVTEVESLSGLLEGWREKEERWLFIAPHDDDIVMGAGLLLQAALSAGVSVSALITTDGSMGYCESADRDRIVDVRRRETLESFGAIGVDEVSWLDFPDCNLSPYLGRRPADEGEPGVIEGFTGLQNAYTHELRRRLPTRLFLASGNDLHPDHKTVYHEARISVFHAGGAIWPELGMPVKELPRVYEWAVYCAFPGDPDYRIDAPPASFERKLEAISAYRSQKQIDRLVAQLREAGPIEYIKRSDFSLYSPEIYRPLFES